MSKKTTEDPGNKESDPGREAKGTSRTVTEQRLRKRAVGLGQEGGLQEPKSSPASECPRLMNEEKQTFFI